MYPIDLIDADVLVIGGGFAGVWAALRAAESAPNVILVEKAYVSRSGASTMSGGVTTCPLPSDDLSAWVEEFVVRGDYMCDQDWTLKLLEGQRRRVAELAEWKVPISRDGNGAIRRFASRGMVAVRCMQYNPKLAMEELRRQAVARGVRIIDRLCITELITSDGAYPTQGSVVGAFGFDVKTGGCVAFRARRTVLATGQISMKGIHHVDNDTGDGVAMAWRAGARLTDLEFSFGGTFSILMKHYNLGSYNVAVAHGARLINQRGERFMEKYDPARLERSELSRVVAAFVKEIVDGRGPVYIDLRHCDDSYWTDLAGMSMMSGSTVLLSDKVPNPRIHPLPIEPTWGLWSGGRGGIDIDLDCRSTLRGLFAAGATAKNPTSGTHASAGVPTAFAMNSGYYAGEVAAREALNTDAAEIPDDILQRLAEQAMAALARDTAGGLTPDLLHDRLAMLGGSIADSMRLNQPKLEALVAQASELHAATSSTGAANLHELIKLHEARNISENARMIYLSALDRTESREQFYRSDYPETDDAAWFCLHGVTRTSDGMKFERIPIQLEHFPLQRPAKATRQLSPMAAIFAGTYQPSAYD
jgi:succinate dehydrogenase / fumarate reductase flavoprotein subunit